MNRIASAFYSSWGYNIVCLQFRKAIPPTMIVMSRFVEMEDVQRRDSIRFVHTRADEHHLAFLLVRVEDGE